MAATAVLDRVATGVLPLWPEPEPEPASARMPAPEVAPTGSPEPAARIPTLEQALDSAWNALDAGFTSDCLLCGGTVHPRWSAGSGVVGGRCTDCGTELE